MKKGQKAIVKDNEHNHFKIGQEITFIGMRAIMGKERPHWEGIIPEEPESTMVQWVDLKELEDLQC